MSFSFLLLAVGCATKSFADTINYYHYCYYIHTSLPFTVIIRRRQKGEGEVWLCRYDVSRWLLSFVFFQLYYFPSASNNNKKNQNSPFSRHGWMLIAETPHTNTWLSPPPNKNKTGLSFSNERERTHLRPIGYTAPSPCSNHPDPSPNFCFFLFFCFFLMRIFCFVLGILSANLFLSRSFRNK
jgi:hypothetical protein